MLGVDRWGVTYSEGVGVSDEGEFRSHRFDVHTRSRKSKRL